MSKFIRFGLCASLGLLLVCASGLTSAQTETGAPAGAQTAALPQRLVVFEAFMRST